MLSKNPLQWVNIGLLLFITALKHNTEVVLADNIQRPKFRDYTNMKRGDFYRSFLRNITTSTAVDGITTACTLQR